MAVIPHPVPPPSIPPEMTDVVQGDFRYDYAQGRPVSQHAGAPGKPQFLDPEIAGEGTKVILSSGSEIVFHEPPAKVLVPDMSQIKSLRKYFGRKEHRFFPCWLYHPTEDPVIVKDAQEMGTKYGVEIVVRTPQERAMYGGGGYRYQFNSDWRTEPYKVEGPSPIGAGKELIGPRVDPNETTLRALVQALRESRQPLPGGIQSTDIDDAEALAEYREFQAWKRAKAMAEKFEQGVAQDVRSEPEAPGDLLSGESNQPEGNGRKGRKG